ncbi:hypothetical protein ASG48_08920 [Aurantimonas sp. Leaf443]|nr:hypothetical protein ASG48_08920 [Aurantimonas sp. Leaf443]
MAPSQSTVVGPAGASAANPMAFARPGAKGTTNWPCVQRKVEDISIGQVWNGPDPASASSVERTAPMRALVGELAARRLPLPEAQARAEAFLKTLPEAERAKTATAVFADLFAILNTERTEIMQGIERYGAKQKAMAETIRAENAKLSKLRAAADAAPADIDQAMQTVTWDTRIFNERRQSLTFVCEVPTIIEQRLFGLGRTLSAGL